MVPHGAPPGIHRRFQKFGSDAHVGAVFVNQAGDWRERQQVEKGASVSEAEKSLGAEESDQRGAQSEADPNRPALPKGRGEGRRRGRQAGPSVSQKPDGLGPGETPGVFFG